MIGAGGNDATNFEIVGDEGLAADVDINIETAGGGGVMLEAETLLLEAATQLYEAEKQQQETAK